METQVLTLCKAMGAEGEELLLPLIEAAVAGLSGQLRKGLTPEDCGAAFPMAAAMTVMDYLDGAEGLGRVERFTAGDVTIQTGNAGAGALSKQAQRLLAPWLGETGFAFRGVRG